MRKVILLLCSVILVSCSMGVKRDAEKQMKKTLLELAKDPNAQVSDVKTVFETDSVVILHCVLRGLNGFGGYARNDIEYIYTLKSDGRRKEAVRNLEDEQSIIEAGTEFNRSLSDAVNSEKLIIDSIKNIEMSAQLCTGLSGRTIDE